MTTYSKRFAASGIGFARKYRSDPFFRTETNIIGLQSIKLLFFLSIGVTAAVLYHDNFSTVSGGTNPWIITLAVGAVIVVTILLSYAVTLMALTPARKALDSQKQFIGNVAHELRTPLSIIKTNTEVALMAPDVSAELRKTLESSVEELDRTSEIINNLLSLSASVRPERMEFTDVDFGEVVRNAVQHLRSLSEKKHLEIEVRISEQRTVFGNAVGLEQIVMNIIKNAITHTPKDGRILVTIQPVHPNYMELAVRDSGAGISRKDLFHIFEPYYRGDPSRKRGGSGSGLGLTIVSELVRLHNGKITVRSAEGRGTTVTVLLPVGRQGNIDGVVKRDGEHASEVAVDFSHNRQRDS